MFGGLENKSIDEIHENFRQEIKKGLLQENREEYLLVTMKNAFNLGFGRGWNRTLKEEGIIL